MSTVSDSDLVASSISGDASAFGILYRRYAHQVKALVVRITGDIECAEDIVSEAFEQALARLRSIRHPDSFGSWVCSIAMNLSKRHFTRNARRKDVELSLSTDRSAVRDTDDGPPVTAESHALNEWVLRAVNDLPEQLRVPTVLYYYDYLRVWEIAQLLSLTVGAVKTRLSRSRTRLRETIINQYNREYFESYSKRRIDHMTLVEILDVVPLEGTKACGVILHDREGQRVFPFFTGINEGLSLARRRLNVELGRPMTYELTAEIVRASGAQIENVRIEEISEGVFFAVVVVTGINGTKEVDARPSDSINIALCAQRPIYVNDLLMDQISIKVQYGKETTFRPLGMEQIVGQEDHGISFSFPNSLAPKDKAEGEHLLLDYLARLVKD